MSVSYRKRQNFFVETEDEWRVEDDALVHTAAAGTVIRLPWRDVEQVRLAYAPTRAKTWRYVFVLYASKGRSMEIDNVHFAGLANFQERSDTYVPFVRAALERIRALAPEATLRVGSRTASYIANLLFVTLALGALTFVMFAIPTPLDYLSGSSFVKLGIILILLPALFRWIRKARPRGGSLDEIPADALPPAG